MIELLNIISAEGSRQVRQSLIPPVVYLDTWAICEFSENDSLSERFRTALLRSRGTLALSDVDQCRPVKVDVHHRGGLGLA